MHIPGIKYNHSCFLCSIGSEYLIKSTGEYIVKVNPHPFNNGHVVVISNEHKPLGEVTPLELFSMLKEAASLMRHLRHIYNPQGFNVGIVNKPHAAIHVVPRWNGDASFVAVVFNAKPVPELPEKTRDNLLKELKVNGQ
ncbi:HIT family hydrolase [Thermocladium modestius]|uniref:HIT family hydrolase n=1 Tax=Thermocladium modestius TaxID=62609 RepID=A0A830GUF2_9CREN|nr:HIT family hydrolase [Thermocladium modestius]GGP20126.1 HIT family hydrolase [Thermocladium modestius]